MHSPKELKNKIAQLPEAPGVYIFKDAQGRIIYIGKAKSLKKRVQSYFSRQLDAKTQILVSKISGLEYRLTASENQAQLLEAALIKEHLPQYNIDLKDDKSFPWIRITDETFPVVSIYRKKGKQKNDRSLYYGPYTDVKLLRQAIKLIRRIFGFRSCKKMPNKVCLYYRLNFCPAPCIGKTNSRDYQELISRIKLFLESKYEELLRSLAQKMQQSSKEQKFEEAAKIRDQINALSAISQSETGFNLQSELEELQVLLKLKKTPQRIEAFDISNISGQQASGSMVSFFKGLPDKNNYRRFRIKTVAGIDDYKMLAEVVHRRYSRLVSENLALPDLILIDGGRSHLMTARKELEKLGLSIPLVSIAKEKENIYVLGRIHPIRFKFDTPALNLIRRIRDEAHRFAISYHHILRRKKFIGK
ncbi:MAG: excinuclease ABC subunit UvrC [Candidatus Omnitrophica bacterium]|nr:excinuclease ABC subunit UvrC [Candidatus Omnitrophota bacterium]